MKGNLFILLFILTTHGLQAQTGNNQDSNKRSRQRRPQIYIVVEEMPVFKYGGSKSTEDSFIKYVNDNIQAPSDNCIGKAYVQFIVEPDSTISNSKVIRGLEECPAFRKQVEKTINSMPKWTPGRLRGYPVRVKLTRKIILKTGN
jgi:protein TonB